MQSDWIKDISRDDLPPQFHEMADIIGVENTLKLAERFPKQSFYFVGLELTIRKKKAEYIHKNFTGDNHAQLARATGYSLQWIYMILKNHKDTRQIDLFREND